VSSTERSARRRGMSKRARSDDDDVANDVEREGDANDDGAIALAGASGGTTFVANAPRAMDRRAFESFLRSRGVTYASAMKTKGKTYGFVTYGALSARVSGDDALRGFELEGRELRVREARERGGGGGGAANRASVIANANAKASRDVRDAICPLWNVEYGKQLAGKKETVAAALRVVASETRRAGERATEQGRRGDMEWVKRTRDYDGMACPLEGIVRSPVLDGYRNKSEFTIGPSAENEPTVGFNVGLFREGVTAVAAPVGCRNISETAKYLANAFETHLRARAKRGEGLPVYDKRDASGFWRLFTVREGGMAPPSDHGWRDWLRPGTGPPKGAVGLDGESAANAEENDVSMFQYPNEEDSLPAPTTNGEHSEVMVMLQVRKAGFEDGAIVDECKRALAVLDEACATATPPIPLKVCLVQFHDGCSNVAPDDAEILNVRTGAKSEKSTDVIHERMCGLRFSLSATAFFQINTAAAEALYKLAGEWASPSGRSLLLDVCCGTGTIGLTLAKNVAKVVGVDVVEASIEDAFTNAKLNGVNNTDWIAGKAEVTIPRVLNEYKSLIKPGPDATRRISRAAVDNPDLSGDETAGAEATLWRPTESLAAADASYLYDDVVAVVDPPRAGLHRSVLVALRRENRLKRLVYVSCNVKTMAENVIELCAPQGADGNGGGVPFTPVKALALDLFPHTDHVEAVLLLER